MTHLRRLPVDILKIDRTFVANLDNQDDHSLIELLVDTGHLLGMSITAEGVETDEQAHRLRVIGSDRLQGFGITAPLPASDLEEWVDAAYGSTPTESRVAPVGNEAQPS